MTDGIEELITMTNKSESGMSSRWEDQSYRLLAGAAAALLSIGTVVYHYLEGWSWVDSLYFSTVAVTTVGFGDLAPTTDGSKLFTVVYIVSGISIVTSYLNIRFKYRAEARQGHSGSPA